jgi:hypothetical protein
MSSSIRMLALPTSWNLVTVPYRSFELESPANVESRFLGFSAAVGVSSSPDVAPSVDFPDFFSPFLDDLVVSFLDFPGTLVASLSSLFFAFSASAILWAITFFLSFSFICDRSSSSTFPVPSRSAPTVEPDAISAASSFFFSSSSSSGQNPLPQSRY